jgi:hypothetical protein
MGGIETCLEEIHDSSGKGFSTDFEGWCATPLTKPVELDRVGIALGDAGFSATRDDMREDGLGACGRQLSYCVDACRSTIVTVRQRGNMYKKEKAQ